MTLNKSDEYSSIRRPTSGGRGISTNDDCASAARQGDTSFVDNPSKGHRWFSLLLNTVIPIYRERSLKPVFENMAHGQPTAHSFVGSETWHIPTPSASSEDTTQNASRNEILQSSIPWPGRAFIIRSRKNGQVITFLDGEVVMDKIGGLGTFRWRCVEEKGWLGFKDPASAHCLGYQEHGILFCRFPHHRNNERIFPRMRPEGGYVLLVRHDDHLRPLGVFADQSKSGTKQKIKIMDWSSEDIVWDFIEVPVQEK
ncbi:hypothetical protein PSV08DRAFT_404953 [Bipolaris maydis]|nr:hypothetical protein J3E73DRAFT_400177 [Bipolaris maydis]KAJ6267265.1 hypothetical protein PSV08DRAFT_404953 [Bipolaris maydis]KAJ6277886.1 hypothetical protein J3E71DRAFT_402870 [Bipolaris maydis]